MDALAAASATRPSQLSSIDENSTSDATPPRSSAADRRIALLAELAALDAADDDDTTSSGSGLVESPTPAALRERTAGIGPDQQRPTLLKAPLFAELSLDEAYTPHGGSPYGTPLGSPRSEAETQPRSGGAERDGHDAISRRGARRTRRSSMTDATRKKQRYSLSVADISYHQIMQQRLGEKMSTGKLTWGGSMRQKGMLLGELFELHEKVQKMGSALAEDALMWEDFFYDVRERARKFDDTLQSREDVMAEADEIDQVLLSVKARQQKRPRNDELAMLRETVEQLPATASELVFNSMKGTYTYFYFSCMTEYSTIYK